MALLVNKKLLNFRWVDADLVLSLAALPALAQVKSITGLTAPTGTGLNNQSTCKITAGKLSGTLKKLVRGQEYQLEAATYSGWTLAGGVAVADLPNIDDVAPVTLVSTILDGADQVPEGQQATYRVLDTFSDGSRVVVSAVSWPAGAPAGVLSPAGNSTVGDTRSYALVATVRGQAITKQVTIVDSTVVVPPAEQDVFTISSDGLSFSTVDARQLTLGWYLAGTRKRVFGGPSALVTTPGTWYPIPTLPATGDDGQPLATADYALRATHYPVGAVQAQWMGARIGNTSAALTGANKYVGYPMSAIEADQTEVLYAKGMSEGNTATQYVPWADIQNPVALNETKQSNLAPDAAVSDGIEHIYAGYSARNGRKTGLWIVDKLTKQETIKPYGVEVKFNLDGDNSGRTYPSLVDYEYVPDKIISFPFVPQGTYQLPETKNCLAFSAQLIGVNPDNSTHDETTDKVFTNGTVASVPRYDGMRDLQPGAVLVISYYIIDHISDVGVSGTPTSGYYYTLRPATGRIKIIRRSDGLTIVNRAFDNATKICIRGSKAFVLSGTNTITRHSIGADGNLSAAEQRYDVGASEPYDLSASFDGALLRVPVTRPDDVSTVLRFNTSTGELVKEFGGEYGSYRMNARMFNTKFYFRNFSGNTYNAFNNSIAHGPNGSWMLWDGGNNRGLRFDANDDFLDYVMYTPAGYSLTGVRNQENLVFLNLMLFDADPYTHVSTPIANYRGLLPANYQRPGYIQNFFNGAYKYDNGKIFGRLENNDTRHFELVEIQPEAGTLQFYDNRDLAGNSYLLTEDGNVRRYDPGPHLGTTSAEYDRSFAGGATNGGLVIGPEATNSAYSPTKGTDPDDTNGQPNGQQTADGMMMFWNAKADTGPEAGAARTGNGWHTGIRLSGTNDYAALGAKSTAIDYAGGQVMDDEFDSGNNMGGAKAFNPAGAGGPFLVCKNVIITICRNEGWKTYSQTTFINVHDSDLNLLLVCGAYKTPGSTALAGVAGNVLSGQLFRRSDGVYVLRINDEGIHAGGHTWEFSGLEQVQRTVLLTRHLDIAAPLTSGRKGPYADQRVVAFGGHISWDGKSQSAVGLTKQLSRMQFWAKGNITSLSAYCVNATSPGYDFTGADLLGLNLAYQRPDGTLLRLPIGGAESHDLAFGSVLRTDPVAVNIPSGERILLIAGYNIAEGQRILTQFNPDGGAEGTADGVSNALDTSAQWVTDHPTYAWGPTCLGGTTDCVHGSIIEFNDSIGHGQGDSGRPHYRYTLDGTGILGRAFADFPNLRCGKPGEQLAHFQPLPFAAYHPLVSLGQYFFNQSGFNDVMGGKSVDQMKALLIGLWDDCWFNYGIKGKQTTITPSNGSTDNWATAENQTIDPTNPVRVAVNDWIRDGSPLSALGTPRTARPIGDTQADTIRAGHADHALFGTGYYDTADAIETSRNSGLAKPGTKYDEYHENAAGYALLAATVVTSDFPAVAS